MLRNEFTECMYVCVVVTYRGAEQRTLLVKCKTDRKYEGQVMMMSYVYVLCGALVLFVYLYFAFI